MTTPWEIKVCIRGGCHKLSSPHVSALSGQSWVVSADKYFTLIFRSHHHFISHAQSDNVSIWSQEYGMDISGLSHDRPMQRRGCVTNTVICCQDVFSAQIRDTRSQHICMTWDVGVMLPYGGLSLVNSPPLPWHILRAKQNLCPTSPAASHSVWPLIGLTSQLWSLIGLSGADALQARNTCNGELNQSSSNDKTLWRNVIVSLLLI